MMQTIEQAKRTLGDEFSLFFDMIQAQVGRMNLDPTAPILDVGTGRGAAAIALALCGFRVLTGEPADDRSAYAKQAWRNRAQQVGVEGAITFEAFDAEQMPFADHAFAGVFMLGALHHMSDPATAVAECARVVSPGGTICIMEPNAAMIEQVRSRHPDHPEPTNPTPFVPQAFALETVPTDRFDVYLIRHSATGPGSVSSSDGGKPRNHAI